MQKEFSVLKNRSIIEIVDGDSKFGKMEVLEDSGEKYVIELSLPYLSGPAICSIGQSFEASLEYCWGSGGPSRWIYFKNLIGICIENDKVSALLIQLFSKDNFIEKLEGLSPKNIVSVHQKIIHTAIEKINGILFFKNCKLKKINNQYQIIDLENSPKVIMPELKHVDFEYIRDLVVRAEKDIEEKNFDSAATKSRTLLEEVFLYLIEKKSQLVLNKGDIKKLYSQVKDLYNMHADKQLDKRINELLSGLEKIVSSIAEMRNREGDAHGVGRRRIGIEDYHARLIVNSAITMAEFLLGVYENTLKK